MVLFHLIAICAGGSAFLYLEEFAKEPEEKAEFGAKVFKISRDTQGNRMTFMKITGGKFKVRSVVSYVPKDSAEPLEEKANILKDGKITHERSREYASHIMEAVVTNTPYKIGGNIINKGFIENL